ncbi:hypothetical protein L2E82_23130 [Cichorium intybus]|uniref:Uncharacterized protein n=1 Tax=Cichorium intybus TaxID=13427 RepID=A0ACB9E002_CICIN|nr:hypothetical protein L2E82_23130 [Cichorium intybus]
MVRQLAKLEHLKLDTNAGLELVWKVVEGPLLFEAPLIPNVTSDIITQFCALLDERLAAVNGGALPAPPVRDSAYYFEKFSKCHPPQWNGDLNPVEAKHWIADIESALMTCGCPDQFKVVVTMSQLRKKANTWWNRKGIVVIWWVMVLKKLLRIT